jgi:NAD+ synthase (glutamine-hydrolysing)
MKLIRVAAAVLNQTPLDWRGNRDHIQAAIREARRKAVSILCLPELCISGYGCEDAFLAPHVQQTALEVLQELLPETQGLIVSFGLPYLYQGGLFNTACLAADGQLLGFVGKQNLAGEGLHYEPRWFKPWPAGAVVNTRLGSDSYPLGDLVFEVGGVRLGFEICEDAWVAQRPGVELAQRGVDIILNPSASHFAFGKHEIRRRFVLEGSRAFQVSYVYANLLGNEAGRSIYDGDAMVASLGNLLASGPRFSFRDCHVTLADVDVALTRMARSRQQSFRPPLTSSPAAVSSPFEYPRLHPRRQAESRPAWEQGEDAKEEEFTRAISLALFDYARKSSSRGFVVSLSGGADSAAVAVMAATALRWSYRELGRVEFFRKFPGAQLEVTPGISHDPSRLDSSPDRDIESSLVRELLTCVYQGTKHSGPVTRQAAATLAQALGATFHEFEVGELVEQYERMVESALGRSLTWEDDDLARQNIQARVRAPGVWLLANLRGALLLATSNRSEAAVGYATMDGDTCGGLAPIAGIDKAFLRRWLCWLETQGPAGSGPIPELHGVNVQQPTAELRPQSAGQTDEQDLMPYDVLDHIERAAIRDGLSPVEALLVLEAEFPHFDRGELAIWTRRFFQLWCRNQWKRERYAPSFHVDDENLDPKTWCRFPILSGGFRRELEQLDRYLDSDQ